MDEMSMMQVGHVFGIVAETVKRANASRNELTKVSLAETNAANECAFCLRDFMMQM